MNDASLQANSILAKSLRMLSELAAPDSQVRTEWSSALVSELSPLLPLQLERPGDLLAANSASPGLRWHADQLIGVA